jgi:hypothetical protein
VLIALVSMLRQRYNAARCWRCAGDAVRMLSRSWRQVLVFGRIPACGNAVAEHGWRRRGGSVRRERMTADHSGEA